MQVLQMLEQLKIRLYQEQRVAMFQGGVDLHEDARLAKITDVLYNDVRGKPLTSVVIELNKARWLLKKQEEYRRPKTSVKKAGRTPSLLEREGYVFPPGVSERDFLKAISNQFCDSIDRFHLDRDDPRWIDEDTMRQRCGLKTLLAEYFPLKWEGGEVS